jgi:hypothetical protein
MPALFTGSYMPKRPGSFTPKSDKNFELKRANEILRTASAFFAQAELDRRRK